MKRKPVVFGNWKMNLRLKQAEELTREVASTMQEEDLGVDAGICPPAVYLVPLHEVTKGTPLQLGGQNCHWDENGAFTGEISPQMLTDVGCGWVILGHSERRRIFGEDDREISKRRVEAFEAGLNVIFCVGESERDREQGRTKQVILDQLKKGLDPDSLTPSENQDLIIAYEPVWAIGTGRTATPQQAQEVHREIRNWIGDQYGKPTAENLRMQYGGSVKPHNVEEIVSEPDIDGALIGGASLDPDSFIDILRNVSS